jgi:hypothetical protein
MRVRGRGSAPLLHWPPHQFKQEDVVDTYENIMDDLEEVAASYGRDLDDTGLQMRKGRRYDGMTRQVSSRDEAEEAMDEGYGLPAHWAHDNEVYTTDGQIEGEFEYEFRTSYRGAIVPANITVTLETGPDVTPDEAEELQEAVDRHL